MATFWRGRAPGGGDQICLEHSATFTARGGPPPMELAPGKKAPLARVLRDERHCRSLVGERPELRMRTRGAGSRERRMVRAKSQASRLQQGRRRREQRTEIFFTGTDPEAPGDASFFGPPKWWVPLWLPRFLRIRDRELSETT
jgi:hypothetical protein